ncbi:MAG: GGDEF domain-containing protein [Eubacterium sp.]|nr:GGDEF domain-containing protein [Eubacterium sp.]
MKKRKTIGFLVSGIMDDFTIKMCNGVTSASLSDDDVNVVVIPVKYIYREMVGIPDKFEYQYQTNSENLNPENMDALIVAADCIGCLTTRENLCKFMETIKGIPTVLIAARMAGYPGVTFDNKSGIIEGIEYLIKEMGITKICMLGGSDDYSDTKERIDTFKEIVDKYGLEYKESHYIATDMTSRCVKQAGELLDNNPDAEAVFCLNDQVAMGLYEAMKERGLVPGQDIKVMGFDNSVSGAMVTPTLSTVDANAVELGRHAYRMVIRLLNGEKLGEEKLATRFIRRDSFGVSGLNNERNKEKYLDKNLLDYYFDKVFYRYLNIEEADGSKLRMGFKKVMNDLIDYINSDHDSSKDFRPVELGIEEFLSDGALMHTDNDELIPYIDSLHSAILSFYNNNGKEYRRGYVYRAISSAQRKIIKEMSNITIRYEEKLDDILYSMKTLVKDSLNFTYGNDHSYSTIVSNLGGMGIKNAYVYVYEKPIVHMEYEHFDIPGYVRLKAALTDGKIQDIPYSKQRIGLKHLFDNKFITDKKYCMVLMPLFFGDTLYGSVLFDLNDIVYRNGEFLTNQFSTAARVIEILKQNNEIQKQLEENLAIMAENNIALDKLSRNDVLTGILNRRGFYDVAESILRENNEIGKDTIVSYIDMNNLKVINDRFGHDDGDYSLKVISSILTEVVGTEGVVGRIGGDEYALVYYGEISEEGLSVEIRERFRDFNETSQVPYNVTVSCGFYRINGKDTITLDDAMASADQDLYIAKQYKDNRILKT